MLRWSEWLDHRYRLGYHRYMGTATAKSTKEEIAGDAWRPLARFFFDTARHRQQLLSSQGLTPNVLRAMTVLAPSAKTHAPFAGPRGRFRMPTVDARGPHRDRAAGSTNSRLRRAEQ